MLAFCVKIFIIWPLDLTFVKREFQAQTQILIASKF